LSCQIIHGHVIDVLRSIDADSVDCCVTSPPYWGLRDYKLEPQVWDGEPECEHEFELARHPGMSGCPSEKQDSNRGSRHQPSEIGFCSKCSAWRGSLGLEPTPELFVAHLVHVFREVRRVLKPQGTCWVNLGDSYAGSHQTGGTASISGNMKSQPHVIHDRQTTGLKPKDLVGVPWRTAFALQADGWWLRSDIIWSKPNPMPESVRDRPTKAHEYVFLLTKSQKYFYDAGAIKETATCDRTRGPALHGDLVSTNGNSGLSRGAYKKRESASKGSFNGKTEAMADTGQNAFRAVSDFRNKRSVWTLATLPTPEAHFATYPIELPEICLLAGSPEGGLVLDPFAGAGTTGMAALKNGRKFLGIELNPDYIEIARSRLMGKMPLFAQGV
jgi:DNA modification methylase